ncbi:MAG: cysteine hydrolase [Dehalococcoidales bacterium]|nr:cysteine hydrolase [Dehalococcoidales bacterium]MDD5509634.1 cysteine hydrolase [Dehalococcoidales bacterium]
MVYKINPALIIIDVQNGFVAPGGSFHKIGYDISRYRQVLPVIQDLYRKVKTLNIPVFFSQALRESSGIDMLERQHQILPHKRRERIDRVPLCIRGTWDSEFTDELKPQEDDYIVRKRRDSVFQDTEIQLWLRSMKIDTIIFSGIDTSICVESSLRDAFNRGWDVILISDATASLNDAFCQTTIAEVSENFGLVMKSEELFRKLEPLGNGQFLLKAD